MKKNCFSIGAISIVIFASMVLLGLVLFIFIYFPNTCKQLFGEPAQSLSVYQRITFPVKLVLGQHKIMDAVNPTGSDRQFVISPGDSVDLISHSFQQNGFIPDAELFKVYLIYSGLDRTIMAGTYQISSTSTAYDIAHAIQDATPKFVHFIILPGWRLEEIAGSLSTSGLSISYEELITLVQSSLNGEFSQVFGSDQGLEGFLLPGDYLVPRETSGVELVRIIVKQFISSVDSDMLEAYNTQGLSLPQAVTLASMVQREAIHTDEMPLISSVFLNRIKSGMKFDSDASVQYALGYDAQLKTWWKSPLSLSDLEIDSPYNTYKNLGFPPGPICNPSLDALKAVAFPANSNFLYFRAKCDKSGYHNFAETFEQQLQNACP